MGTLRCLNRECYDRQTEQTRSRSASPARGASGGEGDAVLPKQKMLSQKPGRVAPPQRGVQAVETGTLRCLNRECYDRQTEQTRSRSAGVQI